MTGAARAITAEEILVASLGHIAVGMAVGRTWSRAAAWRSMLAFSAFAMLPDADVIAFALRIPYEAPFGHRGASHSLVFAAAVAAASMAVVKTERLRMAGLMFVAVGSHGLLDSLTDGGLGIGLLWPFSNERFFAPVQPIPVAPIGAGMLSLRGLYVLGFELVMFAPVWIWALRPGRPRQASAP
jgi:inner membrane protein